MEYDPLLPTALKKEQQWFGSIIGRPIDEDSCMNSVSPAGISMEVEAAEHIVPSATLRPAQRIEIYNQQYWWRILNAMHDTFPLMTRLFGYHDFNRTIGIPYLSTHVPRHWSLHLLGDRLENWIRDEYHGNDKELILNACTVDWAFTQSFFAAAYPRLSAEQVSSKESIETFSDKQLFLQPFIHLFEFPYDLFSYREAFLKQTPEYWVENDFPPLEHSRKYQHILYRNRKHDVSWLELSLPELRILQQFKEGSTVDSLCDWLEEQPDEICSSAMLHLHEWFQEWIQRGWLSPGMLLPALKKPWESITVHR